LKTSVIAQVGLKGCLLYKKTENAVEINIVQTQDSLSANGLNIFL